jgi:drug/metabolite transporter (DMT)-like permease
MRMRTLLAFFAVYVIWGSTYLAIREAVATIPPLMTAGVRHLAAGLILFAWTRRSKARITSAEWRSSVVLAVMFFLVGHGTLHWAERTVPSGVAALLYATEPLWIALLMPDPSRSQSRLRLALGVAAGLAGVALVVPVASLTGGSQQLSGAALTLIGVGSWSLGVRYSATARLPRDPFVRTATTLLCGAALLLVASAAAGETTRVDLHAVSARSLLGLAYLIVFGSVVAFSAYSWLLERCSPTLVATHTYVNPVIAVLLGWLFANEPLSPRLVGATVLILTAILLLKSAAPRQAAGQRLDSEGERSGAAARTVPQRG